MSGTIEMTASDLALHGDELQVLTSDICGKNHAYCRGSMPKLLQQRGLQPE
jgi:hypothetical protein